MFALVSLSVLLVLGSAEDAAPPPSYIPVPLRLVTEPLLNQLVNAIWSSEAKESGQTEALKQLVKEADDNIDFKNDFENNLYPKFKYHQHQQDARLDALAERIAEIIALRAKVQGLQGEADSINDVINNGIYPARKDLMYQIEDLKNEDIERIAQIEETEERARAVNDRIDILFIKSWNNFRALTIVDTARREGTTAVNRQKQFNDLLYLDVGEDGANVTDTPFEGRPQYALDLVVGFQINKYKPSHYYKPGYESIYFGINSIVDANVSSAEPFDMSSGGFQTIKIADSAASIFFDNKIRGLELKEADLELKAPGIPAV